MMNDDTVGKGFGQSSTDKEAEDRGRALLDAMRQSNGATPATPAQKSIEVPEQSADATAESPILGVAGFLIFVGILSLFVGGPLWQPKGFDADGSQPADTPSGTAPVEAPFGFAPKPPES